MSKQVGGDKEQAEEVETVFLSFPPGALVAPLAQEP
jgi:hypothetical protein